MGIEGAELGGWPVGNPSGFIAGAQDAGISATAALDLYREGGGSMRTQTWYRAWGEISAGAADRVAVQGAAWDALPDAGVVTDWATRTADGYLYHFDLTTRDLETGVINTTPASLRTDDLLSWSDALAELESLYTDNAEAYGQAILGGVPLNVFSMSPGA